MSFFMDNIQSEYHILSVDANFEYLFRLILEPSYEELFTYNSREINRIIADIDVLYIIGVSDNFFYMKFTRDVGNLEFFIFDTFRGDFNGRFYMQQ